MSDLKVNEGEPLSATKHNRLADRAERSTAGFAAGRDGMSGTSVKVRNETGGNISTGELLSIKQGVGGYVGPGGDAGLSATKRGAIILPCELPTWHSKISRVLVAAGPIPDGGTGEAFVSGICIARCDGAFVAPFTHAMIDGSNPKVFRVSTGGVARILSSLPGAPSMKVINLGDGQPLFHYRLLADSAAPANTNATLVNTNGNDFGATSTTIELSDVLRLTGDQKVNETGQCTLVGNTFEALCPCNPSAPPACSGGTRTGVSFTISGLADFNGLPYASLNGTYSYEPTGPLPEGAQIRVPFASTSSQCGCTHAELVIEFELQCVSNEMEVGLLSIIKFVDSFDAQCGQVFFVGASGPQDGDTFAGTIAGDCDLGLGWQTQPISVTVNYF